MKKRLGFVSNSSSASFVLNMRALAKFQIDAVLDCVEYAEKLLRWKKDDCYEGWTIEMSKEKNTIEGWTHMDNFEMDEFFEKLGIPASEYEYEGDQHF